MKKLFNVLKTKIYYDSIKKVSKSVTFRVVQMISSDLR